MDFRKLGNLLAVLGAVVLAGACVWWFSFYSSFLREIGNLTGGGSSASVFDAWRCIYSSSGLCSLVSGMAAIGGWTPYEPMLFWFGLAGLVLGVVFRLTAKPAGSA